MGRSSVNPPQSQAAKSLSNKPPSPLTPRKGTKLSQIEPPSKNGKKSKISSSSSDTKYVSSRMEISAVTINMSGRGVLGVTPKYKVDMVETFLKTVPDIVFLQVNLHLSLDNLYSRKSGGDETRSG